MDEHVPSAPVGDVEKIRWPAGLAVLVGVPLAVFLVVLVALKPILILLVPVVLLSVGVFVVLLLGGQMPEWTRKAPRWW